MINNNIFSIIIPTYNRLNLLKKIINSLNNQLNFSNNFEIIICDSNSKKKIVLQNLIRNYQNLNIKYYNCKINHQAYKRNFGFLKSNGKYVLFIDDDCIPDKNFLNHYYKILKLNQKKSIYTGIVKYVSKKNIKNLIKFRQSRERYLHQHIKVRERVDINIFGSMNMAIPKNNNINRKNIFNNQFTMYGFEDYEFAFRFKKNHFNLKVINSKVYHNDFRDFEKFLSKYTYLGLYAINELQKLNPDAAFNNIFYKIKTNFLINIFVKFKITIHLINFLEKILIYLEKKNLYYSSFIYKLCCFLSYIKGLTLFEKSKNNSKEIDLFKIKNWYK